MGRGETGRGGDRVGRRWGGKETGRGEETRRGGCRRAMDGVGEGGGPNQKVLQVTRRRGGDKRSDSTGGGWRGGRH